MSCVVCDNEQIHDRAIVETRLAWAFSGNMPITVGHSLVVPKRHVATFSELSNDEKLAMLDITEALRKALKKAFGATGFNYAWNEGSVAGQSLMHVHVHVVPRTVGDAGILEYEPRKFLYRPGSRGTTAQQELLAVSQQIKNYL